MAFARKKQLLCDVSPDVAVVPECSKDSIETSGEGGPDCRWFGDNPRKGLGVLTFGQWRITRTEEPTNKWVAPVWINGPTKFLLIAVWAKRIKEDEKRSYIGQVYEALLNAPRWFRRNPVVIAGDFNSNKRWDERGVLGNHSAVVGLLEGQQLISAYHHFFSEHQGAETRPTQYRWHRRQPSYHTDYVFLPEEWANRIRSVEVGDYEQWKSMSDHVPVIVDVNLEPSDHGLRIAQSRN